MAVSVHTSCVLFQTLSSCTQSTRVSYDGHGRLLPFHRYISIIGKVYIPVNVALLSYIVSHRLLSLRLMYSSRFRCIHIEPAYLSNYLYSRFTE